MLDVTCYLLAWRFLGSRFILLSIVSTTSMSLFFGLWDLFPPMPARPVRHAAVGGVAGWRVRRHRASDWWCARAAPAAATTRWRSSISHLTHWRLARAYLFTDLTVLGLSLTYIPVQRIAFSLVTVFVSSFLIDIVKDGVPDAMRSLLPKRRNG